MIISKTLVQCILSGSCITTSNGTAIEDASYKVGKNEPERKVRRCQLDLIPPNCRISVLYLMAHIHINRNSSLSSASLTLHSSSHPIMSPCGTNNNCKKSEKAHNLYPSRSMYLNNSQLHFIQIKYHRVQAKQHPFLEQVQDENHPNRRSTGKV